MAQKYLLTGLLGAGLVFYLTACDGTRFLQQGQVLIRTHPKFKGNHNLSNDQLTTAIRSQPNRKVLGIKWYLNLHNLGIALGQDSSLVKRLYRKVDAQQRYERSLVAVIKDTLGEPPALIRASRVDSDLTNIKSLYFSQGFLDAQVEPRIRRKGPYKNKADIVYQIDEGKPFVIKEVTYQSKAQELLELLKDSSRSRSLLKPGDRYNEINLAKERNRLSDLMRNSGYYKFTPEAISYEVDTLTIAREDTFNVEELINLSRDSLSRLHLGEIPDKKFKDLRITIQLPDTVQRYQISSVDFTLRRATQVGHEGEITFPLNHLSPSLRKAYGLRARWLTQELAVNVRTTPALVRDYNVGVIARRIRQRAGDYYSLEEVRRTQGQLNALGIFRNSVATFTAGDSLGTLQAHYDLSLLRNWSFGVGTEGFVSNDRQLNTNLPGFGLSLQLRDRNLFGGAENLDVQSSGNISFYTPGNNQPVQSFFQYSFRANLSFPNFLLLESPHHSLLRLRPTTSFSLSLTQEQRQQFRRTTVISNWQYQWFTSPFSQRSILALSPLSISFIESITYPSFNLLLQELNPSIRFFIQRDFQPRINTKSSFYWAYSHDYGIRRDRISWYLRPGIEAGGNIPFLIDVLSRQGGHEPGSLSDTKLYNKYVYGQFGRVSLEAKAFIPLSNSQEVVARVFVGVARGVNRTSILPYQNRFYTGGTNSVRGWQSNTLGPGTYNQDTLPINNLIAPGGEYAFEANLEYRYPLFGSLRGALFLDAGNVWFSTHSGFLDDRAYLKPSNLQLGVAGGVGFRYDLSFFILRLDIAQQVYAPDIKALVVQHFPKDIGGRRIQYNIGIGYPF